MEIKLIVVGGRTKRTHVTLGVPATIGRSRKADLTVAHPMISRQHCQLFEADGLLRIRDLSSLNGTIIDGKPVPEAPLRPNDEFTIGPITFRVEYDYGGEETAEAPDSFHALNSYQRPEEAPFELTADEPDLISLEVQVPPTALDDPPDGVEPPRAEEVGGDAPKIRLTVPGPQQQPSVYPVEGVAGPTVNVAPSDGQLPDFAAWDQRALEIEGGAVAPAAPEPSLIEPDAAQAARSDGQDSTPECPTPPHPESKAAGSSAPNARSNTSSAAELEDFFNAIQ